MFPVCAPCEGNPLKNGLVLCTTFFFIFTGYNCSVNLLSSINIDQGLGVVSQSVLYATYILGAVTTPPLVMKFIGVKKTIVVSGLLYAPYVAANYHSSWYTFLPSAILVGLAAGPLWAASMTYLSTMAKYQAKLQGQSNPDDQVFRFMGFLFMFFGFSNVFGNLVSFYVLKPDGGYLESNFSRKELDLCGVNFCDWTAIQSGVIHQPPKEKVILLTSLYVACTVLGPLLALACLDPLDLSEVSLETSQDTPFLQMVMAPLRRFKLLRHWLLVPITVFAGVEESFLFGDYTKAYLACGWGVYHIGLSMIACGVVTTIGSPLLGWLVKVVDRAYIFVSAGLLHAVAIGLLWIWTPDTPKYVLYIIPAIWGLVTVIWQSQVRAMYGVLFSEDKSSAFAIQAALEALGFLIGFAISSKVCTEPKLWLLAFLLVVSLVGYGMADFSYRKDQNRTMCVASGSTSGKTSNNQISALHIVLDKVK